MFFGMAFLAGHFCRFVLRNGPTIIEDGASVLCSCCVTAWYILSHCGFGDTEVKESVSLLPLVYSSEFWHTFHQTGSGVMNLSSP